MVGEFFDTVQSILDYNRGNSLINAFDTLLDKLFIHGKEDGSVTWLYYDPLTPPPAIIRAYILIACFTIKCSLASQLPALVFWSSDIKSLMSLLGALRSCYALVILSDSRVYH